MVGTTALNCAALRPSSKEPKCHVSTPRHPIKCPLLPSHSNGATKSGKMERGSTEPAPADARGDARSFRAAKRSWILRQVVPCDAPKASQQHREERHPWVQPPALFSWAQSQGKTPCWGTVRGFGLLQREPRSLTPIPLDGGAQERLSGAGAAAGIAPGVSQPGWGARPPSPPSQ